MTDMETRGTQVERGWADKDGFLGPFQPGNGPRSDPAGEFPTGPAIGEIFPDIEICPIDGSPFSLNHARAGQPALFIAFRSAVW